MGAEGEACQVPGGLLCFSLVCASRSGRLYSFTQKIAEIKIAW
jgi:hypothetical protein